MRNGRRWLLLALVLYVLATWFGVKHGIGASWRQCDTQAIARNFLTDGFDPLRPRVDWRGDTDGAVECEFPLYQLTIACALAVFGEVEWPGRVLSMLAMVLATVALHRLLELRSGPGGALAGAFVFLCGGHAFMLACRVMPDALSLCFALLGLVTFVRYLATGKATSLWLSVAAVGVSALQKPTSLQIVFLMFVWTALLAKHRLREPRLWIGACLVLGLVALWLVHGRALYAETGLTFGVVSGGDTKFPDLQNLLDPHVHAQLLWTTAQYGMSVFGALALVVLLVRRRFDRADLAMIVMAAAGLLGTLRYSYFHGMGPHYHVYAAVAGAWCVARAWPLSAPRWLWVTLVAAAAVHAGWRLRDERGIAKVSNESPILEVAAFLRENSAPTSLVIVRSDKPGLDPEWHRGNNFEDPRLFYQAQRRGFVLPADGFDVPSLVKLRARGGRFVYNPLPAQTSAEVTRWLDDHGEVVLRTPQAVVHRLRSTS